MQTELELQKILEQNNKILGLLQKLIKEQRRPAYITHDCLTLEEVAEEAGRTLETIRDHVKLGRLRVQFPGAKRQFARGDVQAYLEGMKSNHSGGRKHKTR